MAQRPLVLVHGLWDTPRLFRRLEEELLSRCPELTLYAPHLPHRLGSTPIRTLAARLGCLIDERFGPSQEIDLFGFSMGGVIARTWLQDHQGHARTRRFVCLGSPQQGTLTAQWIPSCWLAGIADMKLGSPLLRDLQRSSDRLTDVSCLSLYTPTDITVFPGWRAVLPEGQSAAVPVLTHRQLILNPVALKQVADALLAE
jgi:triacylglycerol lipase